MNVAWWWNRQPGGSVEHRVRGPAEVRGHDVVRSAEAVRDGLAERLERGLDLRRGPLLRALDPRVVDVGAGLAKQDVLDPVGARPAGCRAGLDAEAPDLFVAAGKRGLRGRLEVVPRGGSVTRPRLRRVIDQALDGSLGEDAEELAVRGLAGIGEAGRGVGGIFVEVDEVKRLERALVVPLLHQPRSGETRDVRQRARGDARGQLRGEVTRPRVIDRRPAAFFPRRDHRPERVFLGAGPRSNDRDLAADVLASEAGSSSGAARRCRGRRAFAAGRRCRGRSRALAGRSG